MKYCQNVVCVSIRRLKVVAFFSVDDAAMTCQLIEPAAFAHKIDHFLVSDLIDVFHDRLAVARILTFLLNVLLKEKGR